MIVLVALGAGILTGMAVGGGVILVPALVLLFHVPQHSAQAAVLAAYLATSTVAAFTHRRQGNLLGRCLGRILLGSLPGAFIGAALAVRTPPELLRRAYGGVLVAVALYVLLVRGPAESRQE